MIDCKQLRTESRMELMAFGECLEHLSAFLVPIRGENLASKPNFQYRWSGKSSDFLRNRYGSLDFTAKNA